MRNILRSFGIFAFILLSFSACNAGPKIQTGSIVEVEYASYLPDGTVFETNKGKDPLIILIGKNMVFPKFEEAIMGLKKGAKKQFVISKEDLYGDPDPKRIVTLSKNVLKFPPEFEVKPGAKFQSTHSDPETGKVMQQIAEIVEIGDKDITVDYNHPLAGKDVKFEVKILEVADQQVTQKMSLEEFENAAGVKME